MDNVDGLVHGKHIILVAHNGRVFDIPFLLSKLSLDIDLSIFKYEIVTMYLAKSIIVEKKLIVPTNYKLQTIYQYSKGIVLYW